ncbi:hypothetical protein SETIT_7G177700v2 [Setaria italica]|uniref:Uncharacterized protein n=1 Tax=Setaria italica TaxID=4555 RepID=A0A368RWV0_SETIT|nr:hypothetical protein SETIT_7G177700v2 [Setaria italica]
MEEEGSESSGEDSGERRKRRRKEKERRRRRRSRSRSESSGSSSESESESSYSRSSAESESESDLDSEEERRRRKEKERRKRKEKEKERERRRKEKKKRRKEEKKDLGKKGAVTNSWGKYGIIREVDMWSKRPEFTAWLSEVKQVNLEALSNWEEKQMFKAFMEDHNTATFPSKKYYNLDAYHRKAMEKETKKGLKTSVTERTIFNDEEQRRLELLKERERRKEEEVEALKRSMQAGLAQDMKEQARLREEMNYQYRLGNFQAAAAIQKRLDPDAPLQ